MIFTKKKKIEVLITGGPRSGTSFLSGLIEQMGYRLGNPENMVPPDINNKYGYFEHNKLINISNRMLTKLQCDFHYNLPKEPINLSLLKKEMRQIQKVVTQEEIQSYKGNRLLILSPVYEHLFPEAKWIYIERNIEETYKSRFGDYLSFEDWQLITQNRIDLWKKSNAGKTALNLDYAEFKQDFKATIVKISNFLGKELSEDQMENCLKFYRPKK